MNIYADDIMITKNQINFKYNGHEFKMVYNSYDE